MKKVLAIVLSLVLALSLSVSAFASEAGPTVDADYQTVVKPIFDNILKQLSVANIVSLLAAVIGAGIVFVFLWWAIRKGIKILMSAIRKGRVSS